jgi:hypothetical protein
MTAVSSLAADQGDWNIPRSKPGKVQRPTHAT